MARFWLDDEEEQVWTLQDIYDDLASAPEVAAMLDVTIWRMQRWLTRRERIKSPLPIKRIGMTDIYSRQEWRDWYARWCADPRRAKWLEHAKGNGANLPFFEHDGGPDHGMWTRKVIRRRREAAAAASDAATSSPAADDSAP